MTTEKYHHNCCPLAASLLIKRNGNVDRTFRWALVLDRNTEHEITYFLGIVFCPWCGVLLP